MSNILEWRQGPGRQRNVKPWPGYRAGLVSSAPWRLTVGNETTNYGFNASVGDVNPDDWFGVAFTDIIAGATNALTVKVAAGVEIVPQCQIKIGTDTADLTFVTDEYTGTDATINAAITAADGTTIDVELFGIAAP